MKLPSRAMAWHETISGRLRDVGPLWLSVGRRPLAWFEEWDKQKRGTPGEFRYETSNSHGETGGRYSTKGLPPKNHGFMRRFQPHPNLLGPIHGLVLDGVVRRATETAVALDFFEQYAISKMIKNDQRWWKKRWKVSWKSEVSPSDSAEAREGKSAADLSLSRVATGEIQNLTWQNLQN